MNTPSSSPRRTTATHPVKWTAIALTVLGAALAAPAAASAQGGPPSPPPVAMPPEFASLRARFETLTPAQVQAAGYVIPAPACVSTPFGGMGYHAIHFGRHAQQFQSGRMDPNNPPILLIGGDGRVVGLEWETNQRATPPALFGQTVSILPGHEGLEEPHYMLHAYFRPDGQVLFADFDPLVTCPPPGTFPAGYRLPQAGASPATVAAQLPRTGGGATSPVPWRALIPVGLAAVGAAAAALARRRHR